MVEPKNQRLARYSAGVLWPSRTSATRPARSGACHETSVAPRSLTVARMPCALRSVNRRMSPRPGNVPQRSTWTLDEREVSVLCMSAKFISVADRTRLRHLCGWRIVSRLRGGLHAFLILARCAVEFAPEHGIHVLQRREAAAYRDFRARHVLLREQLLGDIELVLEDFLVHGAAEFAPEIVF